MSSKYRNIQMTPHNLGLYRLEGFSGRRQQLLKLHRWLTGGQGAPVMAISGEMGIGRSTLATAAAWNHFHYFNDGIIRVGAAGTNQLQLYDIVRTMDTVFGTTLTRISEERWGISILEQLYRRSRLLIIDDLSEVTSDELDTFVNIIGHLNESAGNSRILLITHTLQPAIADLVQKQHLHLKGLIEDNVAVCIRQRAPKQVRAHALSHTQELHEITDGCPLSLRLIFGLLLDYSWPELSGMLRDIPQGRDAVRVEEIASVAVESFAALQLEIGPFLNRLVSAAGGASLTALRELFWQDLGPAQELEPILEALITRGLIDRDIYQQRIVLHPILQEYLQQNAMMLGEDWERHHATYYVKLAQNYQHLPLERWPEIDTEWGNISQSADWCGDRIERLWQKKPEEILQESQVAQANLALSTTEEELQGDLGLARDYGLALAHCAFWRHPPSILKWLASGSVAALACKDRPSYGWLQLNIGRQLFFRSEVESAIEYMQRAQKIFDESDLLAELAYVYTDLGTSLRMLDRHSEAIQHFYTVLECIAQIESGDRHGLATAFMNLGSAYYSQKRYQHALRAHLKALRIAMRINDKHAVASAYNNMGLVMEEMGRLEDARQAYELALREFRRIDYQMGISTCYNNLGSVCYAQGSYEQALMWYERDLKLSEERGNWTDMAATLHNLGHVALEQEAWDQALAYFKQSRDLYAAFELTEYMQEEEEMIQYIRTQT